MNASTRMTMLVMAMLCGARDASAQRCPRGAPVAFIGVDVLTMNDSALLRAQTVLVRDGRIEAIGAPRLPEDVCRIDAHGKVLLPGLVDVHVHTDERELPLFLANGVTLVREMNGSPAHLELRRRIENGDVLGPRLVVASPLLTGAPLRYRHRLIRSADDAYAAAHEVKEAGYEFLKIYDDLTADAYRAFVEAGRTLGLRLDGHVPQAVGLDGVLDAGQSIQHMDKIAFALAGHSPDSARLPEARRLFTGKRVWVTPTLASLLALDVAGTSEYAARLERPEMAYMDSGSLAWWRTLVRDGARARARSPFYQFQTALLGVLRESGARFLLGTDAANPLMVAGFSVHEELETLVRDGGFSPYEALLAATRNAAEFLGDDTGGRVQPGARADLLLVDANPLVDLATLRAPLGVMVAGQWVDRSELDAALEALLPSPSPAERAAAARQAWGRAAAAQRAGLADSAWADVQRAQGAWPAQPAYSEGLARLAARRGDAEVLERVLRTLAAQEAGGGVIRDSAIQAAALRTAGGRAAFEELQRRLSPDERSQPRVLSADTTFFPEGLDADARDGTLYLTSLRHRMVYAVSPDGTLQPALRAARDGVAAPFGVAFDAVRGVLWVTTAGVPHMVNHQPSDSAMAELLRVRLSDGVITARWMLGGGTGTPGELALAPDGAVLVSDAVLGRLYRLRPDADSVDTVAHPLLRSPQGIAVDEGGQVAWVADWSHGLLRWDLRTDDITAVETPDDVTLLGIDGLRRAGSRLIGVQNGIAPARIVAVTLDGAGRSVRSVATLDRPPRLEGEPTVGVVLGDRYLYVASSAWPFWTADGTRRASAGALPPVIVRELRLPQ